MAATQTPELADFLEELGLPSDMDNRDADRSKLVEEFEADVRAQLGSRRFAPGLAMALLAVAEEALATAGEDSVDDPLEEFEHEETTSRGRPVNTLNLIVGEKTVRLRPHYNKVQHVYQSLLRRYDYPNMPGHATQAWRQHQDMLRRAFAMTPEERLAAAEAVWTIVLDEFPEHRRRSTADAQPRPFETILGEFPNTHAREPAGALLQGLAYAYYRADAPNVTIETGKVGAGSRRTGRVGDVDGWSGDELVLSIEVKDEDLNDPEDDTFDGFISNLAEWPDATAIVVARSATEGVVNSLAEQNVKVLNRDLMLEAVERWDLNKQMIAAREFLYYLGRVQRHSGLVERLRAFLTEHEIGL